MTYEAWRISYQSSEQAARAAYAECVRLQAKIEQMEQQEPVAWTTKLALRHGANALGFDACAGNLWGEKGVPLYALPGAQPAPSVPEGFAWPECPKRRQSHVLFDDGYEEGWAACMATVQALLAAAQEAKP